MTGCGEPANDASKIATCGTHNMASVDCALIASKTIHFCQMGNWLRGMSTTNICVNRSRKKRKRDDMSKPEHINEANGWTRIGNSNVWQMGNVLYDPDGEVVPKYPSQEEIAREWRRDYLQVVTRASAENPALAREFWQALQAAVAENEANE